MKKIITILLSFLIIKTNSFSQYFQGSFTNVGNKVTVKVKPTGNLTVGITLVDFYIRYNVATTPAFTIGNITPNTTNFPGLSFTYGAGQLVDNDTYQTRELLYTNPAGIPSKTYTAGTEYDLVSFTLDGAPAFANIELASNSLGGSYWFAMADGAGEEIAPTGDIFYGPGFFKAGTGDYLPLANVPVPVKFLGFDVTKKNNSAVLNWSVENESALTDKYIIESSANSIKFSPVGTIVASNSGRGSNSYNFIQDNLSAISNSGVLYYRIKQIDKDGKFVYTPTKTVRLDGKSFAVNASPNPVKSSTKVSIDLIEQSKIIISITDATGKNIKSMEVQGFKGANIKDLNLSNLSSGNYVMKVQAGSEIKSLPLVKVD